MEVYYMPSVEDAELQKSKVQTSKQRLVAGSIFDRLIADDEGVQSNSSLYPVDGVIRSIKRNLTRVLNIHAGGALSNPDLGIPDFNYSTINSREVAVHLIDAVRGCVVQAEPRLKDVEIQSFADADAPLELHFSITGTLRVAHEDELIRISVAMRDGHFYPS